MRLIVGIAATAMSAVLLTPTLSQAQVPASMAVSAASTSSAPPCGAPKVHNTAQI